MKFFSSLRRTRPSSKHSASSSVSPSRSSHPKRAQSSSSDAENKPGNRNSTDASSTHGSKNKNDNPTTNPVKTEQMVKRRITVPVAIFDRPMMREIEYLIDARYGKLKVIGSGSFGVVASAIDGRSGERVAIKKILSAFSSTRSARYVLREVRLLHHLKHPHIVSLLDIDVPALYRSWDDVYIVTPLLRTDLRSALNDKLLPNAKDQKRVAFQLLLGLNHMHSHGLMHRDVKTRNVLLNEDLSLAQLCDLGHSRFYYNCNGPLTSPTSRTSSSSHSTSLPSSSTEQTAVSTDDFFNNFNVADNDDNGSSDLDETEHPDLTAAVTTMIQSAPEISLCPTYDAKVDIWAAGCVIADIIHPSATLFDHTGKRSHLHEILDVVGFPSKEEMEQLPDYSSWFLKLKKPRKYTPTLTQRLGADADEQAVDLVTKMLRFNPLHRPSAEEAMAHPWFDEVRDDCINKIIAQSEDERYNFARSEPHRKTTRSQLKDLVWKEVVAFHPEAPSLGVR